MANLFNSNPLMGLGLALSTFGGQESLGGAINLLNYAQRQQLIDEERRREESKENNAAAYLRNSGALNLGEGQPQTRPVSIAERVFNGFGDQTDTNQVDLMNAVGAENLLNTKIAGPKVGFGKPGEVPYDLRTGKPIGAAIPGGENIPADAALIRYYQSLPDGPEKAQLWAVIRQKTEGSGGEETWGNPVSEIDPMTGKNIQVRYSNKGGRRIVDGAVPARQGNAFDRADYWRGQFKPLIDSATNQTTQSRKVKASLGLNTGTGHIAAINALQKQIDEGAVVRDQDVALIQSAQSFVGTLKGQMERLKSGKLLAPELQMELQQVSDALTQATLEAVNERTSAYRGTMKSEGVEFGAVFPDSLREAFAGKPTYGAKPGGSPFRIGNAIVTPIP